MAKLPKWSMNKRENIGARRLRTIMEKLLEDLSFNTCRSVQGDKVMIDAEQVLVNVWQKSARMKTCHVTSCKGQQ